MMSKRLSHCHMRLFLVAPKVSKRGQCKVVKSIVLDKELMESKMADLRHRDRNMPTNVTKCTLLVGLIILLCHPTSACLKFFVPDLNEQDHIQLPFETESQSQKPKTIQDGKECGKEYAITSNRSVATWNALIRVKVGNGVDRICGGTLVNSLFILTAYSCFVKEKPSPLDIFVPTDEFMNSVRPGDVTVWLNDGNLPDPIDVLSTPGTHRVAEITGNRHYLTHFLSKTINHNDLLLRLENPIDFAQSQHVPVCLTQLSLPETVDVRISGWIESTESGKCDLLRQGVGSSSGRQAGTAEKFFCYQEFVTTIQPFSKECENDPDKTVIGEQICISLIQAAKVKSEGWAMAVQTMDKAFVQIGITSWKDMTHEPKRQFFTNVQHPVAQKFVDYHSSKVNPVWLKEPQDRVVIVSQPRTSEILPWSGVTSEGRIAMVGDCVCGIHYPPKGRIIGGVSAGPNEFRWQTYLEISYDGGQIFTCGGSLINDRFVLTAAHCVVSRFRFSSQYPSPVVHPEGVNVYFGVHQTKKRGNPVKVKRVYAHPLFIEAYKKSTFDYDVALLELEKPLTSYDSKVSPICIPRSEDLPTLNPVYRMSTVTGWGLTIPNSHIFPDVLQKINLKIQPNDLCNSIVTMESQKANDRFLCAGDLNPMKDAASGDSGGPLSIATNHGNFDEFIQVGIVSYGLEEGDKTAGLYTDVRKVVSFIDYYTIAAGAQWCPNKRN